MKRLLVLVTAMVVVTLAAGCQSGAGRLTDQDKSAIRKAEDDAAAMLVSGKGNYADYVKSYYADDATVLAGNAPAAEGHAAIQALLQSFPPVSEFRSDIVDVDGYGDLAYARGTYALTMNPPGGSPIQEKGKYLEIWKKQTDGSWKVRYDSFSSDAPAPGLMLPTGAMAATADAAVQKLSGIVGRWQIDGTAKADEKSPAGPVALALDCGWFAGGLQVVCGYTGSLAGQPYQEMDVYSYDAKTKGYAIYSVENPGGVMTGKLTIQPDTWVHVWDGQAGSKPAKQRLTLTGMTPDGGTWKAEMSVAGGPWVQIGEGKYARAM